MPRALYHITTEANWKRISRGGVLKQGEGYGWDERQGVFTLDVMNWLLGKSLIYLPFLVGRLRGPREKLVLLRVEMTPDLVDKTRVALIAPASTPTGQKLLEKSEAGAFREIKNADDDIVYLGSYGERMIRNTFPLDEFVREIPPGSEPLEYIIESEVPTTQVKKVAEIAKEDIPESILTAAAFMRRKVAKGKAGKLTEAEKKEKPVRVSAEDKEVFIKCLLKSRHKLCGQRFKTLH